MEWNEYISYLLSSDNYLDSLFISLDEGQTETEIPPIIKSSIFMLDKMIEKQGRLNVLVLEKLGVIMIQLALRLEKSSRLEMQS